MCTVWPVKGRGVRPVSVLVVVPAKGLRVTRTLARTETRAWTRPAPLKANEPPKWRV